MDSLRIQIPQELFVPTTSKDYSGSIAPFTFTIGMDDYAFDEPVAWDLTITNTGGALLVEGNVEGAATTTCVRCLEDAKFALNGDIEGYYLIKGEEAPQEVDIEEDEYDVLDPSNIIDIAPLVQAAIAVSVPVVPLCDEDCKGLCQTCGANLNKGSCDCDQEDAPTDRSNPFSVLKDYSFE